MSAEVAQRPAARAAGGLQVPPFAAALGLLGFAVVLWWPELRELAVRWNTQDQESHGWLIAAAVPVLVWLQRDRLEAGGGLRALAAVGLLGASAGYALARAASVDVFAWLAIPFTVFFALWLALGARGARALAFPIGYFLFAIPVWGLVTPVFQWLTVQAVTLLLAGAGLRAFIVDEFVTVPAGTFEIAGGCAGMNFLVVALATASLLAFVERLDLRRAALLVGVGLAVAVVANWVRVAIIIWVGNATDMESSLVAEHAAFGWWVFAIAMVPYFWFARRLAHSAPAPARATPPAPVRLNGAFLAGALALAVAPAWALVIDRPSDGSLRVPSPVADGWDGPEAPDMDWRPAFPGAAAERHAVLRRGRDTVDAYAAVYDRQSPGNKLIGYLSSVAGDGWAERSVSVRDAPGTGGAVIERVIAHPVAGERVVWSWYDIRGRRETSGLRVKALEALHAFGWPRRSGVVALSSRCVPDCEAARQRLAAAHDAGLGRWTPGTR